MIPARPVIRFIASTLKAKPCRKSCMSESKKGDSTDHGRLEIICIVKANARGRSDGIVTVRSDGVELCVRAPARDGQANDAVRQLISKVLDVSRSDIEVSKGTITSHIKVIIVRNLSTITIPQLSRKLDGDHNRTGSTIQDTVLDILKTASQRQE